MKLHIKNYMMTRRHQPPKKREVFMWLTVVSSLWFWKI